MGRMKLLSNVINNATNQVEGFCLVKSVQLKVNVKGAEYLDFTLADAEGEVNAKLWDYQTATHGSYSAGEIIKVRGTVNMFRDTEQLKIDRIRKMKETDEVDLSSIVAEAPIDGELLFKELYDFAGTFKDEDITRLTRYLLSSNKSRLERYPAALRLHHAHKGGLMFHTHTMLSVARKLVEVYSAINPELSSDLVYAGVILHDIAKTTEL
ncbi:MAG: CMP-binding protein, partial [Clostridia bacterium]|nr:CMP-binding protein [Clostridia bacterium]